MKRIILALLIPVMVMVTLGATLPPAEPAYDQNPSFYGYFDHAIWVAWATDDPTVSYLNATVDYITPSGLIIQAQLPFFAYDATTEIYWWRKPFTPDCGEYNFFGAEVGPRVANGIPLAVVNYCAFLPRVKK